MRWVMAAIGVGLLASCSVSVGDDDPVAVSVVTAAPAEITPADFTAALTDQAGLSRSVAACVTTDVFDQMTQAEVRMVYKAPTRAALGEDLARELDAIVRACAA